MKQILNKTSIYVIAVITLIMFSIGLTQYDKSYCMAEKDNLNSEISITIIGESIKSVKPNFAKVFASIESLDIDIEKAKNTNFDRFDNILKGLDELGIDRDDIILESFTSYPNYDYSSGKTLTGYYCTTSFSVNVDNLDNLKNVIDNMTQNEVSCIRNISYQISNLDEIYNQVLVEALDNAKIKAKKLTNQELTISCIKEESVYSSTSLYKTYADGIQNNDLIGQLDVKAKVVVTFS